VPELYAVVRYAGEVRRLHSLLAAYEDFVIKPSCGAGGEGILVIAGRTQELYRKNNGKILTVEELEHHVFSVLSGMYSLGGHPDKALVEYRVQFDPVFEAISYQGVPDIRIIVFFGVPVMSMVRMPTQMSDGRANLHLGAIGAGVDLSTGITLDAVWRDRVITDHPDTGNKVSGVQIPHWDSLLALAARCYELTGICYQGVDIVLDRDKGPLILEINARPGLNIQIANNAGLLPRLHLIEEHHESLPSIDERVAFAKKHFGVAAHDQWRVA
jgi:alpha-L-glutamate ligase-like protein